jgi:replication factor A3
MTESTPRISAQYLEQFIDKTVRITGTVTELLGERATINAGGNVTLMTARVSTRLLETG